MTITSRTIWWIVGAELSALIVTTLVSVDMRKYLDAAPTGMELQGIWACSFAIVSVPLWRAMSPWSAGNNTEARWRAGVRAALLTMSLAPSLLGSGYNAVVLPAAFAAPLLIVNVVLVTEWSWSLFENLLRTAVSLSAVWFLCFLVITYRISKSKITHLQPSKPSAEPTYDY